MKRKQAEQASEIEATKAGQGAQKAADELEVAELTDEQLESVSGGKVSFQDFHFTAKISKSSPSL